MQNLKYVAIDEHSSNSSSVGIIVTILMADIFMQYLK